MNDKSLAEVVKQLEGQPEQDEALDSSIVSPQATDLQSSLLEGLRATEWMLSDLRERCRQLYGYRLHLIDQLQQLVDSDEAHDDCEWIVPGPLSLQ